MKSLVLYILVPGLSLLVSLIARAVLPCLTGSKWSTHNPVDTLHSNVLLVATTTFLWTCAGL